MFYHLQKSDAEALSELTLVTAFQNLSLDNVLLLFNALLLEKPVVVVCANLCVATSIVLASAPLLEPLVWQGILMPVLPRTLHAVLHAPVPIVASVSELPSDDIDGVIFDLDRKKILFSNLDRLPTLPERAKL